MRTIQTFSILGWLLLAWSASALGQEGIPWAKDLRNAQETAAQQRRLVLMHFWAPNCAPCQTVERYVFTHPEVARAISAHYVPLYVNAQALPDVAKKFGVDRWPTDVITTPEGEVLSRTVTPKDAREYIALVNRVSASKGPPQNKWGELAQNQRQPPPTFQSSEYQTAGAPKGGAFAGGEFQSTPPNYQAARPTETTSGFGQYNAKPPTPDSRNPPGKGFPAYNGNPYVDVAPPRGPAGERSAAAQTSAQPTENQFVGAGGDSSGAVTNREYNPDGGRDVARAERGNSIPAGGGSFGAAAGPGAGGEFKSGGDPVAQEWPADNREFAPRGGASKSPAGGGPNYRQVTSEEPATKRGEAPLALDGFCPVTLVESQHPDRAPRPEDWRKGSPQFGAVHRGRTYLFAGEREQAAFLADPDRYSPVLSGFDPVAFAETDQFVAGKRQFGVFYADQIFLFADEGGLERFWKSPGAYTQKVRQAMLQNAVGNRLR